MSTHHSGLGGSIVNISSGAVRIHADGGEPNRVDNIKSQIPMQRGGQPEEVANAILWLLSDEASYATGAILDVSGGNS